MSLKSRQKCFRSLAILILSVCLGFAVTAHAEDPPIYVMQFGMQGSGEGQLKEPYGVAIDSSGNIYVADTWNHRIQKFSSAGTYISQFGSYAIGTYGNGNGQLNTPVDIAFDSPGNIFVADLNKQATIINYNISA